MTTQQALEIIEQVCAQYRGTLTEHQNIQAAMGELRKLKPEEEQQKEEQNEVG